MRVCQVEGCNEKHLAKGFCSHHYWQEHNKKEERKEILRKKQRKYNKTEKGKATEKRYLESEKGQIAHKGTRTRRRARKKGASVERFSFQDICKRDSYVCAICGLPINPLLKHPDPLSVSLEHTVPIARGGSHSLENCTLAHLTCNIRKGVKLLEPSFEGGSI